MLVTDTDEPDVRTNKKNLRVSAVPIPNIRYPLLSLRLRVFVSFAFRVPKSIKLTLFPILLYYEVPDPMPEFLTCRIASNERRGYRLGSPVSPSEIFQDKLLDNKPHGF